MNISHCFGSDSSSLRRGLRFAAWPLALFCLALLLRLYDLGSRAFWLDEIFTFNRASLSPSALALDSFQNHHMPGFFLMLAPLTHMPNPEYWLRLPSAVFGAFAVVMVFIITQRIAGRVASVLAALYLAFSPSALGFAQEARSYTLVMMLILLALYGVVRLAQDWRGSKSGWLCYTLGTALALIMLGDSLPWLIAANLIFVCFLWFVPEPRRFLKYVLLADLAILLAATPLYLVMLHYQSQGVTTSLEWIPKLSLSQIWYSFGSVYLMHVPDWVSFRMLTHHAIPGIVWLVDTLLVLALAASVWRLRHWPEMLITLAISFLFLPCLFLIISVTHPVLLPRYLLWSAAPFAILVGIGTDALAKAVARAGQQKQIYVRRLAVMSVVVLLTLNVLPYYRDENKPNWNIAAQRLAAEVRPGDVLLFSDTGAVSILKFYLSPADGASVLNAPYTSLSDAKIALKQGRRVWVVYGHAGQNMTTDSSFFEQIQSLGKPVFLQKAGKRIVIALYETTVNLVSGG